MTTTVAATSQGLLPYVPKLLMTWMPTGDDPRHMRIRGTLAFVDISGFTKLTERLARKGKVGAEEMSDILSATFAGLLTEARADGADLVKWGGDAVLLLFQGPDHALRAARSAYRMRAALRTLGRISTTSGSVILRMSMGIHSSDFDFFLVGDPAIHRELLISGPGASVTADVEAAASAGQIGLSPTTAALLPPRLLGSPLGDGRLLRSQPALEDVLVVPSQLAGLDPTEVLPVNIRTHLLGGTGEPEHRAITVAFVQFSGTDELLLTEGPAALAEELDAVVRNVQSACADHDVTFFETDINRDGGKIMLTAGAPRSAGHDEERMLRVARLVLDRAGRLPLRIGINRGRVFSGDFGPTFRRTYSVKGDAINLAARVMGKASPGQALATLEVLDRSTAVYRSTELPPFMVKGKSMPIRAAAVGDLIGARDQERLHVPLIGRETEMAVLRRALDDVRDARGRLVEVVGEPGIGKSRLAEELLDGIEDVLVVRAPCEEYESSTAYFPFRRLLREALGLAPDAGADQAAVRLVELVDEHAVDLEDWLPLLGVPLDLHLPATQATTELDEQFRKARLEEVVTEFLSRVLPTATVLVIEDAHLMDDASADLVRRLATRLETCPWLVLVTRRDQQAGFVPEPSPSVLTLTPAPLTAEAALELVRVGLEDHPLPQQALDTLAARGGGNPMFLEALVREAGRSGSVADLPESVEGLMTSQIDRLDPSDRTVLRYAAVLGMVVDEEALGTLLHDHARGWAADDDPTLSQGSKAALRRLRGFFVQERGQLRFRHQLMRDVAYEGLPFSRRKLLHGQVGSALEASTPSPESQCELLSLHFFHAGRFDKAWHYSVVAGERARAKFANGEAIDFFERAVEAARRNASIPGPEVGVVLEELGDVRDLAGLPTGAVDAFRQARRHLRDDRVALANLSFKEARTAQRLGKVSQSLGTITRALHALGGDTSPEARQVRSMLATRYSWGRLTQGRHADSLRWATLAAREAEDSADKATLAHAYNGLHLAHFHAGGKEDLPYVRLALLAYEELGDLAGMGHSANNLGVRALDEGRWTEAIELFERAGRSFRRLGDEANQANAVYNLADVLVRQGRTDEAEPLLADALRIARAVEDEELVALALREHGRALAAVGRCDEALQQLDGARTRFTALGATAELVAVGTAEAECLLLAGRDDEAFSALRGAEEMHVGVGGLLPDRSVARIRGFLLLATGRATEARDAFEYAAGSTGPANDAREAGFAHLGLALLATDLADEHVHLAASQALLEPLGVIVTPTTPARR
jgi:class 3 adenylate cyclase/tetratricopeptide (TPR) repeat protein